MKGQAASQSLYPYTRENPDLYGYAAVAAGTIVGFFTVVLISRIASSTATTAAQGVQQLQAMTPSAAPATTPSQGGT